MQRIDSAKATPTVSIGMPVYNGEPYLRQALDSLLAQDYGNFELVISDNASNDGTQAICEQYAQQDRRITYTRRRSNGGSISNFNRVLSMASGRYFMWAGSHDVWDPSFVSRCVQVLETDEQVVLAYTRAVHTGVEADDLGLLDASVDTRGLSQLARLQTVLWSLRDAYPVYGLMRTEVLRRTGGVRNIIAPDNVLLFELSLAGSFALVPERLFGLRKLPDYGDWIVYCRKLGLELTSPTSKWLYWQFMFTAIGVVGKGLNGILVKPFGMLSTGLCVLWQYGGVRHTLARDRARALDKAT